MSSGRSRPIGSAADAVPFIGSRPRVGATPRGPAAQAALVRRERHRRPAFEAEHGLLAVAGRHPRFARTGWGQPPTTPHRAARMTCAQNRVAGFGREEARRGREDRSTRPPLAGQRSATTPPPPPSMSPGARYLPRSSARRAGSTPGGRPARRGGAASTPPHGPMVDLPLLSPWRAASTSRIVGHGATCAHARGPRRRRLATTRGTFAPPR